jgi:hypothetical protein
MLGVFLASASLGISKELTSVYLRAPCGEIFVNKFTTEDTEVHRGVLRGAEVPW